MLKNFAIVGIIVGLILVIVSFIIPIPETQIAMRGGREVGGYIEYVGGDAYNLIIEASLRGGEIAGATSSRASYLTSGVIISVISFLALGHAIDTTNPKEELVAQEQTTTNNEYL